MTPVRDQIEYLLEDAGSLEAFIELHVDLDVIDVLVELYELGHYRKITEDKIFNETRD